MTKNLRVSGSRDNGVKDIWRPIPAVFLGLIVVKPHFKVPEGSVVVGGCG